MKKIAAMFTFVAVFSSALMARGQDDIFTGTLTIDEGRPTLVRCDLLKASYDLVDETGSHDGIMKILTEQGVGRQRPMYAQVRGAAEFKNGQLRLRVNSIGRPSPGGCTLDALMEPAR